MALTIEQRDGETDITGVVLIVYETVAVPEREGETVTEVEGQLELLAEAETTGRGVPKFVILTEGVRDKETALLREGSALCVAEGVPDVDCVLPPESVATLESVALGEEQLLSVMEADAVAQELGTVEPVPKIELEVEYDAVIEARKEAVAREDTV